MVLVALADPWRSGGGAGESPCRAPRSSPETVAPRSRPICAPSPTRASRSSARTAASSTRSPPPGPRGRCGRRRPSSCGPRSPGSRVAVRARPAPHRALRGRAVQRPSPGRRGARRGLRLPGRDDGPRRPSRRHPAARVSAEPADRCRARIVIRCAVLGGVVLLAAVPVYVFVEAPWRPLVARLAVAFVLGVALLQLRRARSRRGSRGRGPRRSTKRAAAAGTRARRPAPFQELIDVTCARRAAAGPLRRSCGRG